MLLQALNSEENKDGDVVKVIIGTRRIEQGISFKNVRQVHIVTPWYNMNRNNQIIGRASRTLSHQMLSPSKRNVTVFFHVCADTQNKMSSDLQMYQRAIKKQAVIEEVEKTLKENSVDCHSYYQINTQKRTTQGTLTDSFGKIYKKEKLREYGTPKTYSCKGLSQKSSSQINASYYKDTRLIQDKLNNIANDLKKIIFQKDVTISKVSLKRKLLKILKTKNIDKSLIPHILHHIMRNRVTVFNPKGVQGFMSFKSGVYLFTPVVKSTGTVDSYINPIYRQIVPRKIIQYSKPVRATKKAMTNEGSPKILEGVYANLMNIPEFMGIYYRAYYLKNDIKKMVEARQFMLLEEQPLHIRRKLLHDIVHERTPKSLRQVCIAYFGTKDKPSKVDGLYSINSYNSKIIYQCINKNGTFDYFNTDSDKPLKGDLRRLISEKFPNHKMPELSYKYMGFRTLTQKGKSILKIISDDSFSKNKKPKRGCRCDFGSGLGDKKTIMKLLQSLKSYTSSKNTKNKIKNFSIPKITRTPYSERTLCEELELLLRIIDHKDVVMISLRMQLLFEKNSK